MLHISFKNFLYYIKHRRYAYNDISRSFFNKLSVIINRENDIKIHQLNRGTERDSNTISVRSSGRMIKTARVIENCLSSSMFDNKFNFGLTNAKEGKEMKRREGERERERESSRPSLPRYRRTWLLIRLTKSWANMFHRYTLYMAGQVRRYIHTYMIPANVSR